MKKSILSLLACTFITAVILTGGNSIPPKDENVQNKIMETVPNINKFKVRVEHNNKRIAELEQKNDKIKTKLDDYQAESEEKWETFKAKFSNALDVLVKGLKK